MKTKLILSTALFLSIWIFAGSISANGGLNLKNISIEIMDESGEQVYFDVVNPVCGQTLPISILGWEEGIYSITFSNSTGGCVYGEFEI